MTSKLKTAILEGHTVKVYRNLNRREVCYSITNGRHVIGYAYPERGQLVPRVDGKERPTLALQGYLKIWQPTSEISLAGQAQTRRTGIKKVHGFIVGQPLIDHFRTEPNAHKVRYKPKTGDLRFSVASSSHYTLSDFNWAHFTNSGVYLRDLRD